MAGSHLDSCTAEGNPGRGSVQEIACVWFCSVWMLWCHLAHGIGLDLVLAVAVGGNV